MTRQGSEGSMVTPAAGPFVFAARAYLCLPGTG